MYDFRGVKWSGDSENYRAPLSFRERLPRTAAFQSSHNGLQLLDHSGPYDILFGQAILDEFAKR